MTYPWRGQMGMWGLLNAPWLSLVSGDKRRATKTLKKLPSRYAAHAVTFVLNSHWNTLNDDSISWDHVSLWVLLFCLMIDLILCGFVCSKGWGCLGTCKDCMILWGKPSKLFRLKLFVSRKSLQRMVSTLYSSFFCLWILSNPGKWLDWLCSKSCFCWFVFVSHIVLAVVSLYNIVVDPSVAELSLMGIVMVSLWRSVWPLDLFRQLEISLRGQLSKVSVSC